MRYRHALAAVFSFGCALAPGSAGQPPSVWIRSHNASDVDVYLLCGDHSAIWLGLVPVKSSAAYEIPGGHVRCPWGLNFFLVVRSQERGYWAGPVRPQAGNTIELVVEKYAGLSTAVVRP
jgi:hypothetical protein